jgi:hypothetical protein
MLIDMTSSQWAAITAALDKAYPGWYELGEDGLDSACKAIRLLAGRGAESPADRAARRLGRLHALGGRVEKGRVFSPLGTLKRLCAEERAAGHLRADYAGLRTDLLRAASK